MRLLQLRFRGAEGPVAHEPNRGGGAIGVVYGKGLADVSATPARH